MSKRKGLRSSSSSTSSLKRMATTASPNYEEDEDTTGTSPPPPSQFRATTTAKDATCLTDGVKLKNSDVILPWMGFGTYKLGKENDIAYQAVVDALKCGYRQIDTAFIYGGETTERAVGRAIQTALTEGILSNRRELFVTTKHWRKYHGYDSTLQCLKLSLKRLQLDYIDLYLIHWPGPAYQTMNRRKDVMSKEGPWYYATSEPLEIQKLRQETWRAMEDALQQGLVRSIGVSNYSVQHLQELKQVARIMPAVNQGEFHPLYPQSELLQYCRQEGIVLQAYASLGGQDTGKKQWDKLDLEAGVVMEDQADKPPPPKQGKRKPQQKKLKDTVVSLLTCRPVTDLARKHGATPAQILLCWALFQNCVVIPKSTSPQRQAENAAALTVILKRLRAEEMEDITAQIQAFRSKAASNDKDKLSPDDLAAIETVGESALGRLCWRNDPFRHLDC